MRRCAIKAATIAAGMCFPFLPVTNRRAPNLGDIVGMIQLRHFKLWYARNVSNWRLADYQLRQIKSSIQVGSICASARVWLV
jgi:hypothetical protein